MWTEFICDCRQCPEMMISHDSWCVHFCLHQISILDDAKIGVPHIVVINPNIHRVKIFILTTFNYLMDLQKQSYITLKKVDARTDGHHSEELLSLSVKCICSLQHCQVGWSNYLGAHQYIPERKRESVTNEAHNITYARKFKSKPFAYKSVAAVF